jgi:hypothetical protein
MGGMPEASGVAAPLGVEVREGVAIFSDVCSGALGRGALLRLKKGILPALEDSVTVWVGGWKAGSGVVAGGEGARWRFRGRGERRLK